MLCHAVLLFVATLGLVACGGGGGESTQAQASPPEIRIQPAPAIAQEGQTAAFVVTAQGNGTLSYQWQRAENVHSAFQDIPGATSSQYSIASVTSADSGSLFRVVVSNAAGTSTSSAVTLSIASIAPAIITQPMALSLVEGDTANFHIEAAGEALSYQWEIASASSPAAGFQTVATGGNAPTLSFTASLVNSGDRYRVRVYNAFGAVTSHEVGLQVSAYVVPPSISIQPAPVFVSSGSDAQFFVTAAGTNPMSYQWQRRPTNGTNFTDITGATSSELILANVQSGNNGDAYRVIVTNAAGSVASAEAVLNVQAVVTAQVSWTQVPTGGSTQLFSAQFIDANTGWVVGEGGSIFKTTNGGSSWTQVTTEKISTVNGIQFVNSSTGWLVGSGQFHSVIVGTTITMYNYRNQLMKTTDGGQTWTDVNLPVHDYSGLNDLAFIDASTGWVVGEAGRIYKTTDGGASWENQSQLGHNMRWQGVHFVDALHGWIAGKQDSSAGNDALVMRTVDGGTTWTEVLTVPLGHKFSDLQFISANVGWFVAGDLMYSTADGGVTWSKVPQGKYDTHMKVHFTSATNGFLVRADGVVRTTSDGGVTKANLGKGLPAFYNLGGYFFSTDVSTLWVVGSNGWVAKLKLN